MSDILSTILVVCREGFESVLLTALILKFLPEDLKPQYYINFALCWIISLALGLYAASEFHELVEQWEPVINIVTGLVLIYIFTTSKAVYEHAREHAEEITTATWISTHITISFIVLREAAESTIFLAGNISRGWDNTLVGLVLGSVLLVALLKSANRLGQALVNKIIFRVVGFSLLLLGAYYIIDGINDIFARIVEYI
jgi:high-affinity Fe2+/Pb2+ permease